MERQTILDWLEGHPAAVHGDARDLVSRCERSVRRHAREDAWLAAKRYVDRCCREWQTSIGAHASEAYVAQEVCGQLAWELARHEPAPGPGDAEHLAGGPVKDALEQEGWAVLAPWVIELAREEEHEAWQEIVRYTQRRARDLIRMHHLSHDCSLNGSACYSEIALRIARLLAHDYSANAFPR